MEDMVLEIGIGLYGLRYMNISLASGSIIMMLKRIFTLLWVKAMDSTMAIRELCIWVMFLK